VWLLPSPECNFDAPGAKLVGPPTTGSYVATLDTPGKYYYACSVVGHCDAGQFLEVNVAAAGEPAVSAPKPATSPKPVEENKPVGSCSSPTTLNATTNEVFVSCRSPPISLAPGDNVYPDILLPNPYPAPSTAEEVILETVSAEVVDEIGTPVALSEVYLHHIFGDIRFLPAEGAEVRQSPMRTPLPAPYFLAVNTSAVAEDDSRFANFHVIRTTGVAPDAVKACIECWCENTDPQTGSIGCCSKCPTSSTDPAKNYFLEFNVTYKVPPASIGKIEETPDMQRAVALVLDIHGGVEYSVAPVPTSVEASLAIPLTSTFNRTYELDYFCPQNDSFSIIKCWGHQHIGAQCVIMYDTATGAEICSSCPTYGTTPDKPGDEEGYLVGMSAAVLDPPYVVQPGQQVTLSAVYDADQPYAGVMSLFAVVFSGFDARAECNINYAGFVQPPGNLDSADASGGHGNAGSHLTAEELLQQGQILVSEMPEQCTSFKKYLNGTVVPCLPAAIETLKNKGMAMTGMGPGGGMSNLTTCCTSIKSNQGGISTILGEIYGGGNAPTECLCSLGEILLFGYREGILPIIADFSDTCTGREKDGGASATVTNGLGLLLNSVFAPKCPNIAAQINDAGSSSNSSGSSSGTNAMSPATSGGETAAVDGSASSAPPAPSSSSSAVAVPTGVLSSKFLIVFIALIFGYFS
jgi:Stress up-regulated Nod 19